MDEALLSISPIGRGQLVKMLITFELHGIFSSNYAYVCMSKLSNHWHAQQPFNGQGFAEHQFGQLWSDSETALNS